MTLSAEETQNLLLLEADLVTGAVALAELHEHGIPEIRRPNFNEPPAAVLDRLMYVSPSVFTPGGRPVWTRCRRAWRTHRHIRWEQADNGSPTATFYANHGMFLPLHAEPAAKKLLAVRASLDGIAEAREQITDSLAHAHKVLGEVTGGV